MAARADRDDLHPRRISQRAFGGALRHFRLERRRRSMTMPMDDRRVTVITDDERPLVLYGKRDSERLAGGQTTGEAADTAKDRAP